MAPRSSPSTFGGIRIKLLAALAAGLFFGFGVCDLFMRLTAAPVPPLRLTAATTTTTTTTTGLANGQPAPTAATAAAAATRPRGQISSSLRQPPPASAARGVAAHSSSLPSSLPRPPHQSWPPRLWSASLCPANCSSHGVCNLDVGECACELGFAGDDCSQRDEFPCNIPEGDELVSRRTAHSDATASPNSNPNPNPNPNPNLHRYPSPSPGAPATVTTLSSSATAAAASSRGARCSNASSRASGGVCPGR